MQYNQTVERAGFTSLLGEIRDGEIRDRHLRREIRGNKGQALNTSAKGSQN